MKGRLPFTIAMSAGLLSMAIWSSTTHRPLKSPDLDMLGFAGTHFAAGEWHRLITSVFLTHGGAVFWRSWAALTVCVALAERRWGSWPTAGLFWGGHLWAVLLVTLGVAATFHGVGSEAGWLLYTASDVGPSAGYWTCLGATAAGWSRIRRRIGGSAISAGLCVAVAIGWAQLAAAPARVISDVVHLVAFASGLGVGGRLRRSFLSPT